MDNLKVSQGHKPLEERVEECLAGPFSSYYFDTDAFVRHHGKRIYFSLRSPEVRIFCHCQRQHLVCERLLKTWSTPEMVSGALNSDQIEGVM